MRTERRFTLTGLVSPLLAFSCAACIAIIVARFWVLPCCGSLSDAKAGLERLKSAFAADKNGAAIKARMLRRKEALQLKYRSLSGAPEAGVGPEGGLRLLLAKGEEAGIRFIKIDPQQQARGAACAIALETETGFGSLGKFIASLEAMPGSARIDRLAISAGPEGLLDARMLVTCFTQTGGVPDGS